MSDPTTRNLRALAWIVAQDGNEDTETAFAIDGTHVYRRETCLSEAVPRPRYARTLHRDVLADDTAWEDSRAWVSCRQDGELLHPTWSVRVAFETVAIVSSVDAEAAKIKAISRLGLPHAALRNVRATARLLPALALLACSSAPTEAGTGCTLTLREYDALVAPRCAANSPDLRFARHIENGLFA